MSFKIGLNPVNRKRIWMLVIGSFVLGGQGWRIARKGIPL